MRRLIPGFPVGAVLNVCLLGLPEFLESFL